MRYFSAGHYAASGAQYWAEIGVQGRSVLNKEYPGREAWSVPMTHSVLHDVDELLADVGNEAM